MHDTHVTHQGGMNVTRTTYISVCMANATGLSWCTHVPRQRDHYVSRTKVGRSLRITYQGGGDHYVSHTKVGRSLRITYQGGGDHYVSHTKAGRSLRITYQGGAIITYHIPRRGGHNIPRTKAGCHCKYNVLMLSWCVFGVLEFTWMRCIWFSFGIYIDLHMYG